MKNKNIKIFVLTIICCLMYSLMNAILLGHQYKRTIFNAGIHGVGDGIARLLIKSEKMNNKYKDSFAAIFYFIINILFFIFFARNKLDKRFNINTMISIISLPLFLALFSFMINEDNGFFSKAKNFFGIFKEETDLISDISRTIILGILIGIFLTIPIKIGSSTGGIDIIAKYLSIYKNINITLTITIFNYSLSFVFVIINFFIDKNQTLDITSIILSSLKIFITSITMKMLNPDNKIKNNQKFN